MGVTDGTAFRAYVAAPRASWQGGRPQYTYNSGTDNATIVQVMQTASDLRYKWMTAAAAQSLPIEGYGTLGVCMDSAAVIEYQTRESDHALPAGAPPAHEHQRLHRHDPLQSADDLQGFDRRNATNADRHLDPNGGQRSLESLPARGELALIARRAPGRLGDASVRAPA